MNFSIASFNMNRIDSLVFWDRSAPSKTDHAVSATDFKLVIEMSLQRSLERLTIYLFLGRIEEPANRGNVLGPDIKAKLLILEPPIDVPSWRRAGSVS